ncbi:hypothetical protein, partial [Pseudomonas fluorescens]|uniref:hypothetical protein n=1 Tax=Pseudomonas fluorescens TaxID=294 RepID=UPI001CD6747A
MDFSIEGDWLHCRSELAREELQDTAGHQEASVIVGDHREQARSYRISLYSRQKQNPYLHTQIGVSEFNLDDDLLSHGETPHYHRRCIVSL